MAIEAVVGCWLTGAAVDDISAEVTRGARGGPRARVDVGRR